MPARTSAKKRLRQNDKHRLLNKQTKSALRTQIKKSREAIKGGNIEAAEGQMIITTKKIDKSQAKNLLHKNTASRMKSHLAKSINKLKAEEAAKTATDN